MLRKTAILDVWAPGVIGVWSSRQSRNPTGERPVMPIPRFRHVAMPQPGAGNQPGYAWCKRSGCAVGEQRSRCNLKTEQAWRLKH
jgi:hypothetical protein